MRRLLQRIRIIQHDIYILYLAIRHPQTPSSVKIVAGLLAAYIISPVDMLPDFLPFLGYVDEIVIIPLSLSFAYRLIPADILADCRRLAVKSPLRRRLWFGAAGIVLLLICLLFAVYALYSHYLQT